MPSAIWSDVWEITKLMIGPAFGAGIAFYINDYVHRQRKKDEDRTVIYGASFAIGSMLEDFLNVRVVIRNMLADAAEGLAAAGKSEAPLVEYVKPHVATFVQKNSIDLSSLHFLLSSQKGRDAFQKVQHLERIYLHFIQVHEQYNEAVLERQTKISAASSDDLENKNEVDIVGLKTYHSVMDFLIAVVEHVQNDEKEYIAATNLLAAAADEYLDEVTTIKHRGYKEPIHLEEQLRPLPTPIASALKYGG